MAWPSPFKEEHLSHLNGRRQRSVDNDTIVTLQSEKVFYCGQQLHYFKKYAI